jgi:RHS repeat-associated protein
MANISYKASMTLTNRYGWNGGNEYEDEGELNYSNTFYRKYDAQIGRFTGVDMLAEDYANLTPYQFGGNNPVMFNDPKGDKFGGANGERLSQMNAHPLGREYGWTYGVPNYGGGGGGSNGNAFENGPYVAFWGSFLRAVDNGKTPKKGKNGNWGYWEKYDFDTDIKGDGGENLSGVGVGLRWESFNWFGGYATADAAAKGWASAYAEYSVKSNTEISSLIYERGGQFYFTPGRSWSPTNKTFVAAHSSPGPQHLFHTFKGLLKGVNTVAFIHSHGDYQKDSDFDFSSWIPGLYKDADYDLIGAANGPNFRGIAQNYPDLHMFLLNPAGVLLRRDSLNTWGDYHNQIIGSGYYRSSKLK